MLPNHSVVEFEVKDSEFRPVSATADSIRINLVQKVLVKENKDITLKLLSDPGHGLEERVMREQFPI
ncbi:MAG: hypothetical protein EBZ18_05825 [Alphaproteobacteria bacterium]|nr:hypothetical protein [Alphaproteobacteria bacterium]